MSMTYINYTMFAVIRCVLFARSDLTRGKHTTVFRSVGR